jgi:GT2 family glycosyltransferase
LKPDLNVIIVSWNTRQLLQQCLTSVFNEPTGLNLEVFVFDNASSDGTVAMVRDLFPQVRLFANDSNIGFAAANNRILPLCQSKTILLLNSDTVVKRDALSILHGFLKDHREVGAVSAKLLHPFGKLSILECGRLPTLRTVFNHYFFLARLFPHLHFCEGVYLYAGKHDREPRRVQWISGACLMMRREAYEQTGGLTERWFMYGEDVEWCARLSQHGWKIFHVPSAEIEHRLGASADQKSPISVMPITAARELYVYLNRPSPFRSLLFDSILFCGLTIRAFSCLVRGCLSSAPDSRMWRNRANQHYAYASAVVRQRFSVGA